MNILVLNGSPKGSNSITLQTVLYWQKKFSEHAFSVLHVGQRIKHYENHFEEAKRALEEADLLIFAYPVYTFLAPCQLHRFIELMKEHQVQVAGKYATQLSTSKHFYDVTAHAYIRDNCQDMEMKYLRGLSADMEDLLHDKGQQEAEAFFKQLMWQMDRGYAEPTAVLRAPGASKEVTDAQGQEKQAGDVVIVTDLSGDNKQLQEMIQRFRAVLPLNSRVVDLAEYPFSGGCLGCFNCAVDGTCIYKDGFDTFLRENIQKAQAVVYAFTIRDHSMGARFKMYDDRQFCNGHRTVTTGMPVGYLISGSYQQESNLQMVIEGRSQVGGNPLAGIATDETNPDEAIDQMAQSLVYLLENPTQLPANFYGVGGMKIFRDLIWQMQGMMKADHKFYKAHGQYDFPQKKPGAMLKMYLVGALLANKKIKAKMGNKMTEGMLAPYRKVLDKIQ